MATRRPFSFQRLYNTLIGGFAPIGRGALGQRASIETQLQYGPALQALVMLGQQTSRQHKQQVTGIRRGGFGAAQGIGQIAQDFQGLLGSTPAPTGEAYGRLGLTRDAVTGSLARMQAQQIAGIQSGTQRAQREFSQNRQDIITQMLQQAQKGALYNAGQYAGYAEDRRKERKADREFRIRQENELRRAGIDPATGKYDPSLDAPPSASERKTEADLKFFQEHGYYPGTGKPSGGRNSMTPEQRRARIEKYAQVRDTVESVANAYKQIAAMKITDKDGKTRAPTSAEVAAAITKRFPKAPPIVLHAGNQLSHGFLTSGTISALKRRYPKIQVPHDWHPPAGYGVLRP